MSKIEKILRGRKKRILFDNFADEFKRTSIDEKLLTLASLNYYGFLEKAIEDYESDYKEKQDIIDGLKTTLQYYISYIENGQNLYEKNLQDKKVKKLIPILKEKLKNKIEVKYNFAKLIKSYLQKNTVDFEKENDFFRIDLNEDLTPYLKERDIQEGNSQQESYTQLYSFLKNNLIPDYQKKNFKGYMVDMGMDYHSEYLIKHFLSNKPTPENYLDAIIYSIKILFLNKPPYHKFFLLRINFNDTQKIEEFWESNEIGVRFDTDLDFEDWRKLKNGEKPKQQYIQRWHQLEKELANQDVIVCASYKNLGYKIGILKKDKRSKQKGEKRDFYEVLKLENVKKIDLDLYPFIQTLIPQNTTISVIKRKNYKLRKIYQNMIVNTQRKEFDPITYEILVNEWLRYKHAPENLRLKYQLLKTGGNKKDIDIYGMTCENQLLAAQISDTSNQSIIQRKINKLEKYEDLKKIFFFNIPEKKEENYQIINLETVISDLEKDSNYKGLLEELC